MLYVIRDYGLWNIKPCDDMIAKIICSHFIGVVICGHHIDPFGKIIYRDNDITMSLDRVRITCHKFNTSFCKWSKNDNNM